MTKQERLLALYDNDEKAEAFAEAFIKEISSDDEKLDRKGRYMAKAILDNNLEDFLIAVCGWSAETLLNIAEFGEAHPKKSSTDTQSESSVEFSFEGDPAWKAAYDAGEIPPHLSNY